jgi:hypothetical protein
MAAGGAQTPPARAALPVGPYGLNCAKHNPSCRSLSQNTNRSSDLGIRKNPRLSYNPKVYSDWSESRISEQADEKNVFEIKG